MGPDSSPVGRKGWASSGLIFLPTYYEEKTRQPYSEGKKARKRDEEPCQIIGFLRATLKVNKSLNRESDKQ